MKWLSLTLAPVGALLLTGCINYYYPPQSYPGGPEYAARDNLFPAVGYSTGAPAQPANSYYPYSSLDYFYLGHGYGSGYSNRRGWGYDPWYGFSNPHMPVYPYPPYQYAWYSPIHYHYHYHQHHYAWYDPYWYDRHPGDTHSGFSLDKPDWGIGLADDGADPANRPVRDNPSGDDDPPNDFEPGDNAAFISYSDPSLITRRAAPVRTGGPVWIRSPRDNKPGLSRTHPAGSPDDGDNIRVISSGVTTEPSYRVVSRPQPVRPDDLDRPTTVRQRDGGKTVPTRSANPGVVSRQPGQVRAPSLAISNPKAPSAPVRISQPSDLNKVKVPSSRSPGGISRTLPAQRQNPSASRQGTSSSAFRASSGSARRPTMSAPRSRAAPRASAPRAVSPRSLNRASDR